jgi:hypothetical protein
VLQQVATLHLWRSEQQAARSPVVPTEFTAAEWIAELEEELNHYRSNDAGARAILMKRAARVIAEDGLPIDVPKVALNSHGLPLAGQMRPVAPELTRLIELLRRAEMESLQRALDRAEGDHGDRAHDPMFATVTSLTPQTAVQRISPLTLGEAITRFKNDPTRAHLTDSADAKYVMTFRALREVVGDDRALADINRADCARVQELLAGIPPNLSKLTAYRGAKTLMNVAKLATERGEKLMAQGTLRVYTHTLSSFFNWAIKKGLVTSNPATRLAPARGRSETSRRPFTIDELNKLVATLPEWSGATGIARGGRFWVPLIAIWSGI